MKIADLLSALQHPSDEIKIQTFTLQGQTSGHFVESRTLEATGVQSQYGGGENDDLI